MGEGGKMAGQKFIPKEIVSLNEKKESIETYIKNDKIPQDVGDIILKRINTDIIRINKGEKPIFKDIKIYEEEGRIKIDLIFTSAFKKTQVDLFEDDLASLNVTRDAQEMDLILPIIDKEKGLIKLDEMPQLVKKEMIQTTQSLETKPQEIEISSAPIADIQKSTEVVSNAISEMEETLEKIESKAKKETWWTKFKEDFKSLKDLPDLVKYASSKKNLSEIERYVTAMQKIIKLHQETKKRLEQEKGENKEKIEKLEQSLEEIKQEFQKYLSSKESAKNKKKEEGSITVVKEQKEKNKEEKPSSTVNKNQQKIKTDLILLDEENTKFKSLINNCNQVMNTINQVNNKEWSSNFSEPITLDLNNKDSKKLYDFLKNKLTKDVDYIYDLSKVNRLHLTLKDNGLEVIVEKK
ncbi:MAG: hypothetical protein QXE90_03415 [Candidatus Micrarchaeia archaeon]